MQNHDVKLVLIEWQDSKRVTINWEFVSEIQKRDASPVMIQSVGYLIRETDQVMEVAPHLSDPDEDGDRQACGVMVIPKACIDRYCTLEKSSLMGSPPGSRTGFAGGVIRNDDGRERRIPQPESMRVGYQEHERLVPRSCLPKASGE